MIEAVSGRIFDVAVIGAGVFGAWTAYQLQRSGQRVVLIDARGPGNNLSSSGDESRIIRMGYGADEIYTRSALASLRQWKEFSERVGEAFFIQTGVLWLAQAGDPYPTQIIATLRNVGVRYERLTTEEMNRRYPQIGTDGIAWALLELDSGVLRCDYAGHGATSATGRRPALVVTAARSRMAACDTTGSAARPACTSSFSRDGTRS